jgi:hypothetical protein
MESNGSRLRAAGNAMRAVGGVSFLRRRGVERRDSAILSRYGAGETFASIALTLGLTRERVRQIVKASGAMMPSDLRCAMPGCDRTPRGANTSCYVHRIRLKSDADPSSKLPLLKDEHGTYASYRDRRCRCDLCRKASADRRRAQFHRVHPEWSYKSKQTAES